MSALSLITTLQVTAIGQFACDMLASSRHLEVLASFSQAVYFRTDNQELIWMAAEGSPMHRRCLQCTYQLPKLEAGFLIPLRGGQGEDENGLRFDTQETECWHEPEIRVNPRLPVPGFERKLLPVLNSLLNTEKPLGLGVFLPVFLDRIKNKTSLAEDERLGSLSPVTRKIVERVLTCLHQKEQAGLPQAALNLIGLGEGLTPSGDDFLGGLLFARYIMDQACPGSTKDKWNYSEFIRNSRHLTNEISFTLLQDHALGHSVEPLHKLAAGLLEDRLIYDILPHARTQVAMGHSTGWDILAGFSIGLLSASGW